MILSNVNIIGKDGLHHIHIKDEKIISVFDREDHIPAGETVIDCEGALAFPGLINSHDHLDFNLYPQLGNRVYKNYTEWAEDIHQNNKKEIDEVLKIPLTIRTQWGIYKNLLNGFTTAVNHGEKLKVENDLITILQNSYSLHSPAFEKNWKWKLNFSKRRSPVAMHMGEGSDDFSSKEIDRVIKWNFFNRDIIAIHGVAMSPQQAKHFKSLVWCPASNYFLLNKTANIAELKTQTKILFGTDSTLSAPWNAWEHLRLARKNAGLTDEELFDSLTKNAAEVWKLNSGEVAPGKNADIVIARKDKNEWDSFFEINPNDILIVMRRGEVKLFDEKFYRFSKTGFDEFEINGSAKCLKGNILALLGEIKEYFSHYPAPLY